MQSVQHLLHRLRYCALMNTSTLSRKSIPIDADELSLAQSVRTPGTPERLAVEAVVGPLPERISEAQALATLLSVARVSVREQVTSAGYAAYAAALNDEDRAFAAANRSRRSEHARRRSEAGRE